jgi:hypothetical protein
MSGRSRGGRRGGGGSGVWELEPVGRKWLRRRGWGAIGRGAGMAMRGPSARCWGARRRRVAAEFFGLQGAAPIRLMGGEAAGGGAAIRRGVARQTCTWWRLSACVDDT